MGEVVGETTSGAGFRNELEAIDGGFILSVSVGEYRISPLDAFAALLGAPGSEAHQYVVRALRLPRALVALCVGIALGVAGAVLQGITRNPLAAPSVVGITQGAALAAVAAVVALPTQLTGYLPVFAFAGAAGSAVLVYLLSWKHGLTTDQIQRIDYHQGGRSGVLSPMRCAY